MNADARPTRAIVMAAGIGQRMRPITDRIPKPLIAIGGRAMLDHALDRLAEAGVTDAVVNVHHLADLIEEHVAARRKPRIVISDERDRLLETGGGAKKALPHLGPGAFFTLNSDSLWTERSGNLAAMAGAWNPAGMDMLLLVARRGDALGFDGAGDFETNAAGQLTRRSGASAPFVYAGASIVTAGQFADTPDGPFSLNLLFDRAIARGRLFGHLLQGVWLHVGTPDAIAPAEARWARETV